MAIPIPGDVRQLLDAPNYVHLSTLRADGSPRNWVVWAGLEDDHILVCTSDASWKLGTCAATPASPCRPPTLAPRAPTDARDRVAVISAWNRGKTHGHRRRQLHGSETAGRLAAPWRFRRISGRERRQEALPVVRQMLLMISSRGEP
jgi:hypothetical protein